jgi:hypothetical protein
MGYVDVFDLLPRLTVAEQGVIRDLLIDMIGLPRPPQAPRSRREIDAERRKAIIVALRHLQRKNED